MSRWIASILLAVAFLAQAPAHARDWVRTELPGIVIYSDGYPHELQRWALKVRLFDALLREQFGVPAADADSGSTLTIYLLDEGKDVEHLTGRKNLNGHYSPSSEGSYLIASRAPAYDKTRLSGQMALFHEYTHHFMYRHFASAWPVWYSEGFAEEASTVAFDADRTATVGLPNWPRMRQMGNEPMPLKTILTASVEQFKPGEKARFYAWSWKLVHMLGKTPEDRGRLDAYLRSLTAGIDPIQAARDTFGDLDALEARMHGFVPDPHRGRKLAIAAAVSSENPVNVLDPSASQLVDLRLARLAGKDRGQVLAGLRAFVAANPGNAQGRLELALALRQKDVEAAHAEALAALDLIPQDPRSLAVWADLSLRQIKSNPASTPASWDNVRARLTTAIAPDTRDPLLLLTLFRSYLMEPRRPSGEAIAAMERALALQPESYEMRTLGVYALALAGKRAQARQVARVLASDPHASDTGRKALMALDVLEQPRSSP